MPSCRRRWTTWRLCCRTPATRSESGRVRDGPGCMRGIRGAKEGE
ncbi:hypothetical protein ACFFX0_12585 [Citricoccus parietis]|uniref:Uncharacterized protein n=1 Tax=Citricoccus parietis TaxID=592307 RepID=A0ABV5G0H0_9MICC